MEWVALGKIAKSFAPYIIGAVVVMSLFFGGMYIGSTRATAKCDVTAITKELKGEREKNVSLQTQYDASLITIKELRAKKDKVDVVTKEVIKNVYVKVPVLKECNIHADVISEINKVRSGVSNEK